MFYNFTIPLFMNIEIISIYKSQNIFIGLFIIQKFGI